MSRIYQYPLRVYICLALLALFGVFAALSLPISLFPNSSKPSVMTIVQYGNLTSDEFKKTYGGIIESRIRSVTDSNIRLDQLITTYKNDEARFEARFDWGTDPQSALKNVESAVYGISGQLPKEIRDHLNVWQWSENSGFIAISFYSDRRGLDDVYNIINPSLAPLLAKVTDAKDPDVWNPAHKDVSIQLKPELLASLQILPGEVASAINEATSAYNGGSISINTDNLRIQIPRSALTIEQLREVPIVAKGRTIHISDIAIVDIIPSENQTHSFRTSGAPSLILFSNPKPGGNIKLMSEQIISIVEQAHKTWPKDIQYRVLVDPSEFIRTSIDNVIHEVLMAAALAVFILFLFIGSVKNVVTAAIEIPMSIVLAFILMKFTGVNINLISLGGLALSAGMNVDASVVVMENIFRHFDKVKGVLSFDEKVKVVTEAVNEVKLPVIASTIASVVVFLPLAFTSNLSYAILGDLAKAVVFSHAFSAVVALILVPTIRLQLMSKEVSSHARSPIEKQLRWLEKTYVSLLGKFLNSSFVRNVTYSSLAVALALLVIFILPRLPKEIIGKPDTDWVIFGLNTQGNTLLKQMETQTGEAERKLLEKFGDKIQYTFMQVNGKNRSNIMLRLKDKRDMALVKGGIEESFPNTPFVDYWVDSYNPSELPIPDRPQMQVSIMGGTAEDRIEVSKQLRDQLEGKKLYDRFKQYPNVNKNLVLTLHPYLERWASLSEKAKIKPSDLSEIARVATEGVNVATWTQGDDNLNVFMKYPADYVKDAEDLGSIPIGVAGKIIPFKALADVQFSKASPEQYRENMQDLALVQGRFNDSTKIDKKHSPKALKEIVDAVNKTSSKKGISLQIDDPEIELTDALHQLAWAIGLSILLIFVTMIIQLGDIVSSLLVLVSVPLGFIGVLISLFVFRSTLSLNSALGVILLNGLAVANSIILVDFLSKLVREGRAPREAALEAAQARLRPILMTSLATAMGMLPIALGLGSGGKILQPLGIAVSCGLWFSMMFTLFIVPSLQVSYLNWKFSKRSEKVRYLKTSLIVPFILLFSFQAKAAKTITFDDAVQKLIQQDLDVAARKAALEHARSDRLNAFSRFLPTVSVEGKVEHDTNPFARERDIYLIGRMNLFSSGSDIAKVTAANLSTKAEEEDLKQATLNAEEKAVELVSKYVELATEMRVAETIFHVNEDLARISQLRFRKGIVAEQEALKAGLERDNSHARFQNAEQALIETKNQISTELGESFDIEQTWPWIRRWTESNVRTILAKKFALDLVPGYRANSDRYSSQRHLRTSRLLEYFPSVDLSAAHGYFDYDKLNDLNSQLVLTLRIPLFDLGKIANYNGAGADLATALVAQERTARDVKSTFETAKTNFQVSLDSARLRESNVKLAESLLRDNRRRMQAGRTSVNDLVVDQNRLTDAQVLAVNGWRDAHINFAKYCHSLGLLVSECR